MAGPDPDGRASAGGDPLRPAVPVSSGRETLPSGSSMRHGPGRSTVSNWSTKSATAANRATPAASPPLAVQDRCRPAHHVPNLAVHVGHQRRSPAEHDPTEIGSRLGLGLPVGHLHELGDHVDLEQPVAAQPEDGVEAFEPGCSASGSVPARPRSFGAYAESALATPSHVSDRRALGGLRQPIGPEPECGFRHQGVDDALLVQRRQSEFGRRRPGHRLVGQPADPVGIDARACGSLRPAARGARTRRPGTGRHRP